MSTDTPTGTIAGTVTAEESGAPLAGAAVRVRGTVEADVTNARGEYSIAIRAGAYEVEATDIHRTSESRHVSVTIGETSTADFSLRRASIVTDRG